jgi:hypothetical protein
MTDPVSCQKCGSASAEQIKFTWWGGVLGPKLLHHVKCRGCGNKFNGKTGKDNTKGIITYSLGIALLAFGFMFVIFFALELLPN